VHSSVCFESATALAEPSAVPARRCARESNGITTRLNAAALDTARQARSYERDHKNRRHVLKAATRRIERG